MDTRNRKVRVHLALSMNHPAFALCPLRAAVRSDSGLRGMAWGRAGPWEPLDTDCMTPPLSDLGGAGTFSPREGGRGLRMLSAGLGVS